MPNLGVLHNQRNCGSLTARQAEVVFAIREYQAAEGISPTLEDIATKLGIQRTTVAQHIKLLQQQGYLTTKERSSRSIRLTAASMVIVPKKSRKARAA